MRECVEYDKKKTPSVSHRKYIPFLKTIFSGILISLEKDRRLQKALFASNPIFLYLTGQNIYAILYSISFFICVMLCDKEPVRTE